MSKSIERIYHPYWLWEDYLCGMYGTPMYDKISNGETEEERLEKVKECLGNEQVCKCFMQRVINEWKYACEYRLSNRSINRVAWLGQACMCLYAGLKESETRKGWWTLTDEERERANNIAKQLIDQWEQKYYG